jgi:hypothetical protein
MQNIIGSLAQSFGIPPQIASSAINGLTSMFLNKSSPKAAEGLLSALPKDVTDNFSQEEKQKFTTQQQQNINRYDVIKQLSQITGIKDIDKLDNFTDALLDSIKKNTNINLSDGLDKNELFQALDDFSRQSGSDSTGQADISGQKQYSA